MELLLIHAVPTRVRVVSVRIIYTTSIKGRKGMMIKNLKIKRTLELGLELHLDQQNYLSQLVTYGSRSFLIWLDRIISLLRSCSI